MTQYNSLNVELSNSELKKLKSAIKNETEVVLRLSSNTISDNEAYFPHKMIQSGGFLGRLLGPFLKTGLPLIKNVIKPLAKSVLIPLGLTAAASAADAEMHKKISGSGHIKTTTLIISNNEIEYIIKIVKSLEDSGLLLKGVTEIVQNEVKEQKGGFPSMSLGTLGVSLLQNLLTG